MDAELRELERRSKTGDAEATRLLFGARRREGLCVYHGKPLACPDRERGELASARAFIATLRAARLCPLHGDPESSCERCGAERAIDWERIFGAERRHVRSRREIVQPVLPG